MRIEKEKPKGREEGRRKKEETKDRRGSLRSDLLRRSPGAFVFLSIGGVGKKRDVSRPLDRGGELTLMHCAGPGDSSGQDLAPFACKLAELHRFLVVDLCYFILTEDAHFFSSVIRPVRSDGRASFRFSPQPEPPLRARSSSAPRVRYPLREPFQARFPPGSRQRRFFCGFFRGFGYLFVIHLYEIPP